MQLFHALLIFTSQKWEWKWFFLRQTVVIMGHGICSACFDVLMQFELRERQKRAEPQSEAAERRRQNYVQRYMSQFLPPPEPVYVVSSFSILTHTNVIFKCPVRAPGLMCPWFIVKNMGLWRWALVSPDGVAPSRMVGVSASVNLPKSRSSLLASAHPSGPGKRAVKRLWCGGGDSFVDFGAMYIYCLFPH